MGFQVCWPLEWISPMARQVLGLIGEVRETVWWFLGGKVRVLWLCLEEGRLGGRAFLKPPDCRWLN